MIEVTALLEFERPKVKLNMIAFLGLIGYYRLFYSARLSNLTKKEYPNTVQWTPELERDFQELKSSLSSCPMLRCPDTSCPYLQTDVFERGIGAVFSQDDDMGEEKPIAYFSRKLQPQVSLRQCRERVSG